MASLNYYLEKRKSAGGRSLTENLPVLLYFSYEGKRFQYYTGERIDLKYWDHNLQRLYPASPQWRQVNDFLDHLEDEIWDMYRKAKASGIRPGNDYFRRTLRKGSTRSSYDFFDVFMKFIDEKHQEWSITTFRKVKTVYNHLRTFSEYSGYMISFEKINKVFLKAYIEYFTLRLGHSNNTCHINLMVLKRFLNWASEKGYNRNNYYRAFRFPWIYRQKYGSSPLMLDQEELFLFLRYELTETRLQQARDIFCFMCFTGMKHEEINDLKKRSVTEDWVNISKAGKGLLRSIPLNIYAREILQRYTRQEWQEERCFPAFSNVTMNQRLKKIAELAGLDKQVEVIIYSGTTERHRKIPKWQAMSTRVAGNTFIMTAFELGIPAGLIKEYTGFRSLAGVRKYESAFAEMKKSEMSRFDRILDHSTRERGR